MMAMSAVGGARPRGVVRGETRDVPRHDDAIAGTSGVVPPREREFAIKQEHDTPGPSVWPTLHVPELLDDAWPAPGALPPICDWREDVVAPGFVDLKGFHEYVTRTQRRLDEHAAAGAAVTQARTARAWAHDLAMVHNLGAQVAFGTWEHERRVSKVYVCESTEAARHVLHKYPLDAMVVVRVRPGWRCVLLSVRCITRERTSIVAFAKSISDVVEVLKTRRWRSSGFRMVFEHSLWRSTGPNDTAWRPIELVRATVLAMTIASNKRQLDIVHAGNQADAAAPLRWTHALFEVYRSVDRDARRAAGYLRGQQLSLSEVKLVTTYLESMTRLCTSAIAACWRSDASAMSPDSTGPGTSRALTLRAVEPGVLTGDGRRDARAHQ